MGLWEMQLEALQEMEPYFAASGSHLYLKSARAFNQKMDELKINNRCATF